MIEPLLQAERLLVHGQVNAAERIYQSTIAADPRNSIAVVGLARVALERGDDRLAYEKACQALEIDLYLASARREFSVAPSGVAGPVGTGTFSGADVGRATFSSAAIWAGAPVSDSIVSTVTT